MGLLDTKTLWNTQYWKLNIHYISLRKSWVDYHYNSEFPNILYQIYEEIAQLRFKPYWSHKAWLNY